MESYLAIISDTIWFTPSLLVMLAMTVLLAEVLWRRTPVSAGGPLVHGHGQPFRPKSDILNAKLLIRLLSTIGVAVITGIAARAVAEANNFPLVNAVMFTGSGLAMGLMLWTWKLVTPWRTAHHKVVSERKVGRELNLLMLDGCRVFHDLVDDRIGEIDHIVVAPHAIFTVETHNQSVPASSPSEQQNVVEFNGRELSFPKRTTEKPVKKAAAKARWLSKHLERRIGVCFPVQPVLVLPGWQIQRTGEGEVRVVNLKDVSSVLIDKAAQPLYEAQRQRVINFLDSRCQYAPF